MNGPGTVNNRTQVQVPLDQNETVYVDTPQPNVYNIALATLKTVSSIDVEKFLGGAPNQELRVRASGLVTLKHNFGGAGRILLNTSADKLLSENQIYTFTYVDDAWVEAAAGTGGGGGGGTTTNPLTINASNTGAASPASFNGSTPITISANTVGAVALADFVSLGDAEWVQLDGAYANPTWIVSLPWSKITGTPDLSGYVVGPASALNNAVARYDGTTGKLIKNTGLSFLVDDLGIVDHNIASTVWTSGTPIWGIRQTIFGSFTLRSLNILSRTIAAQDYIGFQSLPGIGGNDAVVVFDEFAVMATSAFSACKLSLTRMDTPAKVDFNFNTGNELRIEGSLAALALVDIFAPVNAINRFRLFFDITHSEGLEISAASTGAVTFNSTGSAPGIIFSNLAGVSNRLVIASSTGQLSASIPSADVILSTGSYANPAWITSLAWSKITGAPSFGFGDVVGPASATINTISKYADATGKLLLNTGVTIDSGNNLITPGAIIAATINSPVLEFAGTLVIRTTTANSLAFDTNGTTWTSISSTGIMSHLGQFRVTTATAPQAALRYDASNFLDISISAAGLITFNATGASAAFVFSDAVTISPLAGVGSRMVVADAVGLLSTAAIPAGGSAVLTIPINAGATANITLTNQVATGQFLANSNRNITRYDLTGYTEARLIARVITGSASANSPRVRVMYDLVSGGFSTAIGNFTNIANAGEVACSMTTAGVIDSGWVAISATAQADSYLAVTQIGGDGVADPALGPITLFFR
jgi:hypothetical protein